MAICIDTIVLCCVHCVVNSVFRHVAHNSDLECIQGVWSGSENHRTWLI